MERIRKHCIQCGRRRELKFLKEIETPQGEEFACYKGVTNWRNEPTCWKDYVQKRLKHHIHWMNRFARELEKEDKLINLVTGI